MNQKKRFTEIFNKNLFGGKSSRSGVGSSLEETECIRGELPKLFKELNIKRILDAPCGDWHWMKEVDLSNVEYIGADIVDEIIKENQNRYTNSNITFININIIEDVLPIVDLIFCRDCLVHLKYEDIFKVLNNFKKSRSKYLLTTTFPFCKEKNRDLLDKEIWRVLNLEEEPFFFIKPIKYIIEHGPRLQFNEKMLALWCLEGLEVN